MVDFVLYFFICNIFISGIICVLFTAKKILGVRITNQMQYRLSFILFLLFALPFIPLHISDIISRLNMLTGIHPHNTNTVINKGNPLYLAGTSKQINDFAISVSRQTTPVVGSLLSVLWFVGICFMIFLAARSLYYLHGIIHSSLPLQNRKVKKIYDDCLAESGISIKIPIYSTAFIKSPVIAGFLRPRIYLPIHIISDHDAVGIRFMLLHELQHYRHKDMIVNYLINIAGILYWFNPFVWYALKEIRCEREIACDSSVLQMLRETEYEDYGHTLIDLAEKLSRENTSFSPFPFIAGIGGNMRQLKKRILNISSFRRASHRQKVQSRLACLLILAFFIILLPVFPSYAGEQNKCDLKEGDRDITYVDLSSEFQAYKGSFVLYDSSGDTWTIYNKDAALERTTPNSTYKIYDALLGLESGIITPKHTAMTWNGKNYPFDAWNSDQDLRSAMRSSVNWYFQNMDKKIGIHKVKSYLQDIGYGNQKTSGDIDLYWTDFSLKISPVEQVELLTKFYQNDFHFSIDNINAVKDSILISSRGNGTLSGKTGTGRVDGQDTNGWFIGYIEKSGHVYYFATNIQGTSDTTGNAAFELSLSVLSEMRLWENIENR